MSNRTSNLVAELRDWATFDSVEHIKDELLAAADTIERLTAELVGVKATLQEEFRENARRAEKIDRLRATVEELRTVSAGLRAALEKLKRCRRFGASERGRVFDEGMDTAFSITEKIATEALAGQPPETSEERDMTKLLCRMPGCANTCLPRSTACAEHQ